jgi:hypothetical protein
MNREFQENCLKEIYKQSQNEAIKDYLNLRDNMKPSYGVFLQEGQNLSMRGPPYRQKLATDVMRLTMREYRDKFKSIDF